MLGSPSKRTALLLCAAILTVLPGASAQTFVGAAFQQAFTSTSTLESPRGLSLELGADRIWGPLGLTLGYQRVSQGSGVVNQTCGIFSCLAGPFDQSHSLETVGLGLFLRAAEGPFAILTVGANVSLSSQAERLEHVDTGEVQKDRVGPDFGFGLSTRLELPLSQKLHPFLSAQFDRIIAGSCDADASCFPDRTITRLSIGVLWRP